MSHKKQKHKNNKPAAHQRSEGDEKNNKSDHVRVDGRIEATIHPDLVQKYDTGQSKQESREAIKLRIEIATLIVLFIYTSVTLWQACTTHDVAKTSQRQLELDQRPWVGLMGNNHIAVEVVKNSPIKIKIELQNVGKTPALDEASVNNLTNHPIGDPMPTFNGYSRADAGPPITLMPNAIAVAEIATDKPGTRGVPVILSDADIININSGKVQLFLYGTIWYSDTFGKSHRTDYCLQYLPSSGATGNSFGACATHNYAD